MQTPYKKGLPSVQAVPQRANTTNTGKGNHRRWQAQGGQRGQRANSAGRFRHDCPRSALHGRIPPPHPSFHNNKSRTRKGTAFLGNTAQSLCGITFILFHQIDDRYAFLFCHTHSLSRAASAGGVAAIADTAVRQFHQPLVPQPHAAFRVFL